MFKCSEPSTERGERRNCVTVCHCTEGSVMLSVRVHFVCIGALSLKIRLHNAANSSRWDEHRTKTTAVYKTSSLKEHYDNLLHRHCVLVRNSTLICPRLDAFIKGVICRISKEWPTTTSRRSHHSRLDSWLGLNSISESDGSQCEDRGLITEVIYTTEVIYSGSDQDYDSGDEETHQERTERERVWWHHQRVESEYFHMLLWTEDLIGSN